MKQLESMLEQVQGELAGAYELFWNEVATNSDDDDDDDVAPDDPPDDDVAADDPPDDDDDGDDDDGDDHDAYVAAEEAESMGPAIFDDAAKLVDVSTQTGDDGIDVPVDDEDDDDDLNEHDITVDEDDRDIPHVPGDGWTGSAGSFILEYGHAPPSADGVDVPDGDNGDDDSSLASSVEMLAISAKRQRK